MNNQNTHTNANDLIFQHYLIVFLDILGQRRILREIRELPTNENDKEAFLEKVRKTVGKVDKLRNAFKDFFNASKYHVPNTSLVPQENRKEFIASQKSEAYFYGFSDSIIVAVPLISDDENCTAMNGVYSALVATCGIGFISLAATITFRAGLDVGIGTQIEGREVYGPALERAYFIESNLAEYPRFVVGKELINYLLWVENQECKTRFGLVAKGMAKFCKEMIRNYNQKKGYYWPAGQLIGQKIPPFFDRRNCRPQARLNKDLSRSITGIAIMLILVLPFLVTFSTGTRWSQRKPISFR